ncbi:MAG: UDP-3-O-(3-hydroxymyristoyl)glucosamine N-acyltransferase [Deltaproteobacteria bacterium]|nr:UDP-3-O-(3-hydroxymyristoyl)glucosamine N-acyltransferase [Deltaproteobacteria bacterium]
MKLSEIAEITSAVLEGDGNREISGLAGIEQAGPGELTFLSNPRYRSHLKTTRAGAIFLEPGVHAPEGCGVLRTPSPYLAFAQIIPHFCDEPRPAPGVHASAVVDPSARLGADVSIGPNAVIDAEVVVGDRTTIGANATVYRGANIGSDCKIHSNAVVRERVRLGNRVILQNGAVIGADGFGFAPTGDNRYFKMVQAGTVVLEDDVEIGANTTVDRATVGATVIGRGTKLDNLVQIGHGCEVGEDTVLAAQTGIAGSTKVGSRVMTGGQTGITGHATIGDDVVCAAKTGVVGSVPSGAQVAGFPQVPIARWRRLYAALNYLPDVLRRLRRIEKKLGIRREGDERR